MVENNKREIKMKDRYNKGQATLEIAVFSSLLLICLGALLNYSRNIREQQLLEQRVFREALRRARNHTFTWTEKEKTHSAQGAALSLSRTRDRQSRLLFEPNRRTQAASYAVYWSSAENPPELNYSYINQDKIDTPKKILTVFRSEEAFEIPEKELTLSTWDMIAILYPLARELLLKAGFKVVERPFVDIAMVLGKENWWNEWGGVVVKTASFGYLLSQYYETVGKLEKIEKRRRSLKDEDEKMGRWGWRISTGSDKDRGYEPGKFYIKEVSAQTWDVSINTKTDYNEYETKDGYKVKNEKNRQVVNQRQIKLTDAITRTFHRRYDTTVNSTLPSDQHTYEYLDDLVITHGLGEGLRYEKLEPGQRPREVIKHEKWTTPNPKCK